MARVRPTLLELARVRPTPGARRNNGFFFRYPKICALWIQPVSPFFFTARAARFFFQKSTLENEFHKMSHGREDAWGDHVERERCSPVCICRVAGEPCPALPPPPTHTAIGCGLTAGLEIMIRHTPSIICDFHCPVDFRSSFPSYLLLLASELSGDRRVHSY